MHKLLGTIKERFHEATKESPHTEQTPIAQDTNTSQISEQDVYRYRKQRGVNLGSWFVLERWIAETPFQCAKSPAQSDLDVAHGTRAREILKHHWDTWMVEDDWHWLAEHGFNSVRIPIGYYHLCGVDQTVLRGTGFEPYYDTYCGAWERLTLGIRRAAACNIGVLIDLHAAPGKQNDDAHAGTSGPANFFNDSHNQKATIHALCSLVKNLNAFTHSCSPPLSNIIGIELLNEPSPPSDRVLQQWYTKTISAIRAVDPTMPLYIGDCWRPEVYASYIAAHRASPTALTVVDHHLYRCFTASDTTTTAHAHTLALADPNAATPKTLARAAETAGRAGGGIVVGEWSGALNPGSLTGAPGEQRELVRAQLGVFERVCAGWFWWTYKKERKGDAGWSLRDAVRANVFPRFVGVKPRRGAMREEGEMQRVRDSMRDQALAAHTQYWSQYPGRYDHARFSEGYLLGWDNAYRFIASTLPNATTVNEIGFTGAWARRQAVGRHGAGYWEFEAGFVQGVEAAVGWYQRG